MNPHAFRSIVACVALASAGAAFGADTPNPHRQPGPSAPKASAPATVTAAPATIHPGGGDPKVTINSQPVPPGKNVVVDKKR